MKHLLAFTFILTLFSGAAIADTIMSAPGGGLWPDSASWVGGVVPGVDDQVIIDSSILVPDYRLCYELQVTGNGVIAGTGAIYTELAVTDRVLNYGTIENGTYFFNLSIGGDVVNSGSWSNHETTLSGGGEISFKSGFPTVFESELILANGGDLLVETAVHMMGGIDLGGGTMTLNPDCPLTVEAGLLTGGNVYCAGNELRFLSWSYLSHCVVDAAIFVGTVSVGPVVEFTGGATNTHTLQNERSIGNGHVTISGGLTNLGLIRNDQYGFTIDLSGNLVNDGVIQNSWIQFDGQSEHHISGGPDGVINANIFLPEFQGGTIVADTPLRFESGIWLGSGTLILSEGSDLSFGSYATVNNGEVMADGNTISMDGLLSRFTNVVVDQAVLAGVVQVDTEASFTGGVTVLGILQSFEFGISAVAYVEGTLRNEGQIRNMGQGFEVVASDDVVNLGILNSGRFILDGVVDQHVAAGPGIGVSHFAIESNIVATGYQWTKNGIDLPGKTDPVLVLAGVHAADYGVYQCVGEGGIASRLITIDEFADLTGLPPVFAGVALDQNHPNPFNPATEISFSLEEAGQARLSIFDSAGRLVDLLLDAHVAAGRHTLAWRPENVASGVYFYRLDAGSQRLLRKAMLIK